jgi:hypothetical protein
MQSPGGGGGRVGGEAGDIRGRHRIQAELKKLEQEARFLEVRLSLLSFFCHLLSQNYFRKFLWPWIMFL